MVPHPSTFVPMYSHSKLARKYLQYFFTASNGKGHGIHSPFVFDFVISVLNDKRHYYAYESIENLRQRLLDDKTILEVDDLGAGSIAGAKKHRTISSIVGSAAKNRKLSQLLFRLVHYYQPDIIIELGTSLGISSSYMASANPEARLISIEGAPALSQRAREHHQLLGINNIEVITGNFDDTLPSVLRELRNVSFAFVDGNHRLDSTIKYFEQLLTKVQPQSIFVFDDIHWSDEMEEAWRVIQAHEQVTATIDLFFLGIALFRPEFRSKQHFNIRF